MNWQVGNPEFAYLALFGLMALALSTWAAHSRRRVAKRFGGSALGLLGLPRSQAARFWLSAILVASSLVLLAVALMDIRWGKTERKVPQKGIEVVFALDVSRSMLAEDARPNRLKRAKQQIKDLLDEMAGDRVGLIAFAGDARRVVPLTSHYDDFKQILDGVGPHSVRRGGSSLGTALQVAADSFIEKTNDHKAIVLFTDGEDQESQPVKTAQDLHRQQGIRIFTVGLGDMDQGARIPDAEDSGQFVEYRGQTVWSKMNGQILKQVATETDGAYVPAGTKRVNMRDVYHGYIADVGKTEFGSAQIDALIPRFQWFAGFALFLLLFECWWASRQRTTSNAEAQSSGSSGLDMQGGSEVEPLSDRSWSENHDNRRRSRAKVGAAALLLGLLVASPAPAQSYSHREVAQRINAANQQLKEDPTSAIDALTQIDIQDQVLRDQRDYNLAVAHYRNGDTQAAESMFRQTATSANNTIAANSRYNLGNCHYTEALSLAQQDRASAIRHLQSALDRYRSSLRLDPGNADARANIELARHLMEQLQRDEQEKPQQQNTGSQSESNPQSSESSQSGQQNEPEPSQPPSEETSDRSQESSEASEKKGDSSTGESMSPSAEGSDESRDSSDASQKESESPSQSESQDSQAGQTQQPQQSANSEDSGGQSEASPSDREEKSPPSDRSQPNESTGKQTGQAGQEEPFPNDQPSRSGRDRSRPVDPTGSAENDRKPGETEGEDPGAKAESTDPTGQLAAAGEATGDEAKEAGQALVPGKGDPNERLMSREEALKILQAVRDRDLLRRLRQQQRERSRRVPVERDW